MIAPAQAERACWQDVLADWSDGTITDAYEIGCYREALRRMPEDVRLYSSAAEDIERALAERLHPARGVASARPVQPVAVSADSSPGGYPSAPFVLAGALAAAGLAGGTAFAIWRRRGRGA